MPFIYNYVAKLWKEHRLLGLVLLLALIHGLIYVLLIPPWQHYDEPGHFEYAWLIANHKTLPQSSEYDQAMRRELAASMIENKFFLDGNFRPNLISQSVPIWIGFSQINDRPLYYILVATTLYLVRNSDITFQLYLGRLVSLLLYLVTILAAYGIMTEITQPASELRWIVPATIVLLPGFADLMTAVNDDVGATAFFSLFLWIGVRLIHKGYTWLQLLALIGVATLCFWTKDTVIISIPLLVISILFSVFRGPKRRVAWGLIAVGSVLGALFIFSWGDAADWYRSTSQRIPTRAENSKAVLGKYVLQLGAAENTSIDQSLLQPIPSEGVRELEGKTVTLGAWMWASEPVEANAPILHDDNQSYSQLIALDTQPAFFAFQIALPRAVSRLWVTLSPEVDGKSSGKDAVVYYDGLVLVEGKCPVGTLPKFKNSDGKGGEWGGEAFTNWIRNPSAEAGGARIRPWFDDIGMKIFPNFDPPSFFLYYLFDWSGVKWHYQMASARLFRTFWGKFGWANVSLIGHKPYRVLLIFTIVGFLGALIGFRRFRKILPLEELFALSLSATGIYGLTFVRGATNLFTNVFYLPVARYAYPAIIPTVLVLSVGWLEVLRETGDILHLSKWGQLGLYFGLLLLLDAVSVTSIVRYYF